jgi:hypothetical protein
MSTESAKCWIADWQNMSYRKWTTALTGVICVALALWGGFCYPLTGWSILEVIGYEVALLLLTYGILRLVYSRAIVSKD